MPMSGSITSKATRAMTVFGSQGRKITREYGPGDVGYVPQGFGHYIETVGAEPCEMLAVFNSGTYQEIALSDWLAKTPKYLLEANFGKNPGADRRAAKRQCPLYVASKIRHLSMAEKKLTNASIFHRA